VAKAPPIATGRLLSLRLFSTPLKTLVGHQHVSRQFFCLATKRTVDLSPIPAFNHQLAFSPACNGEGVLTGPEQAKLKTCLQHPSLRRQSANCSEWWRCTVESVPAYSGRVQTTLKGLRTAQPTVVALRLTPIVGRTNIRKIHLRLTVWRTSPYCSLRGFERYGLFPTVML
jgi:hypothetical protein